MPTGKPEKNAEFIPPIRDLAGKAASENRVGLGSDVELTGLKISVKEDGIDIKLSPEDFEKLKPNIQEQLNFLFQEVKTGLEKDDFDYLRFKIIITQIIEKLPPRLKEKIKEEDFTETKFERLKREVKERKARMKEWMNNHPEFLKLNTEQLAYLNSNPTISDKIPGILRRIKNNSKNKNVDGTLNHSKAIIEFKQLYNAEVSKLISQFVRKIKKLLPNPQKAKKDEKFFGFLKKNFNLTDPRNSGIAKLAGMASGGMGSLFGGASGYKLVYLIKNNNLEKFVGTENVQQIIMDALSPTGNHQKDIMKTLNGRFDEIFQVENGPNFKNNQYSKTVLSNIQNTFEGFNGTKIDKGEGKVENIEFIVEKLKTIPKGWHNIGKGTWTKKYEKYVLKIGKGSLDFDDWIDTQEVNMFQKAMAWIKTSFSDILGFFGFGKNDKKYERIDHYEELLGITKEKKIDEGDKRKPKQKAEENQEALKNIADDLDIKIEEIKIQYNGKPLIKNGKVNSKLKLSELNNVIEKLTPFLHSHKDAAKKLLLKDLDFKDLMFIAEHDGEDNPDGINIEVGEDGLEFSYDWGKTMSGIFDKDDLGGWIPDIMTENELTALGMLAGGGGVALAIFTGVISGGIIPILGIGAATLGGGLIGSIGDEVIGNTNQEEKNLSFKDLNSQNLKLKIREFKIYVGEIKEKIKSFRKEDLKKSLDFYGKKFDWQSIGNNFPKSLISNGKMNTSLASLLNLPSSYWGNPAHKMTQEDLNNFAIHLEKGTFDKSGILGSSFHVEDNQIEVNGSSWVWGDKKVNNVKDFFVWLGKQ